MLSLLQKPIEYTEEELRSVHEPDPEVQIEHAAASFLDPPLDRLSQLRQLMDSIPTNKEGVWFFLIRWDCYDQEAMSSKFLNWVSTKVEQLLGMPEPSLVSYVNDLLRQHTSPSKMFEELQPVLDADTETFVIKLYRMVIYETEKVAAHL
jgi:RNA-binding protein 25